jgi:uroporphyrinogen-III synthase
MKRNRKLQGLRVWVTRPEHQAEALCGLIEAQGGKAVRLPLLSIQPPQDPAAAHQLLARVADFDWVIFTSINAVQNGVALAPGTARWPTRRVCIGAGTAHALEEAGLGKGLAPDSGSSSEDVLALPPLQSLRGQRVLLVKGEGGRDLLPRVLGSRGALVEQVEVYRRVPAEIKPKQLETLVSGIDAIVVTSGEALEHLAGLASQRSALFAAQLVVPSRRVVQLAQDLGFICTPLIPAHISDQDILDTLHDWHANAAH